jgi:hypothetical protein
MPTFDAVRSFHMEEEGTTGKDPLHTNHGFDASHLTNGTNSGSTANSSHINSSGHANGSNNNHINHTAAGHKTVTMVAPLKLPSDKKGDRNHHNAGVNNVASPFRSPIGRVANEIGHIASEIGHHVSKHKINSVIFNYPMPRQEWINGKFIQHHEKNDEAWVELFIDLLYVVLLSALTKQLEYGSLSVILYFKVAVSFWIVCLTRQAIDEYSNRFYCHDVVQKYIYFFYTIAVFIQASAIQFDYLHQIAVETEASTDHHVSVASAVESDASHSDYALLESIYSHNKLFSSGFAISVLVTRICLLFSK